MSIFHDLNCFGHMIYVLQTSMYWNIVEVLTDVSVIILYDLLELVGAREDI